MEWNIPKVWQTSTSPSDILKTILKLLHSWNQTIKNEGRGSTKEWTFPLQKHQQHLHWQTNWAVGFLVVRPTDGKTTQVSETEGQVDIERSAVGSPWPTPSPGLILATVWDITWVSTKTTPGTVPTASAIICQSPDLSPASVPLPEIIVASLPPFGSIPASRDGLWMSYNGAEQEGNCSWQVWLR